MQQAALQVRTYVLLLRYVRWNLIEIHTGLNLITFTQCTIKQNAHARSLTSGAHLSLPL